MRPSCASRVGFMERCVRWQTVAKQPFAQTRSADRGAFDGIAIVSLLRRADATGSNEPEGQRGHCPESPHRAASSQGSCKPAGRLRAGSADVGRRLERTRQGDFPRLLSDRLLYLAGDVDRWSSGPGSRYGRTRGHAGHPTRGGRLDGADTRSGAGIGRGMAHRLGRFPTAAGAQCGAAARPEPLLVRVDGPAGHVGHMSEIPLDRPTLGSLVVDEPGSCARRQFPCDARSARAHAGRSPRRHHRGCRRLAPQRAHRISARRCPGARSDEARSRGVRLLRHRPANLRGADANGTRDCTRAACKGITTLETED